MRTDRFPLGFICGIAMAVLGYLAWANKSDWDQRPGIDIEPAAIEQQLHLEPKHSACWSNNRDFIEYECHQFGRDL